MDDSGPTFKRVIRVYHVVMLLILPLALTNASPLNDALAGASDSAFGAAPERILDPQDLFDFEKTQLPYGVADDASHSLRRHTKRCKTYPDDVDWPSEETWEQLGNSLGGALIKTIPEAAVCHSDWPVYDISQCQVLASSWGNSTLRIQDPTSIRSILFQGMTCMPPNLTAYFLGHTAPSCVVGGYPEYTVNATTVAHIQLAVKFAGERNLRLVIKNTGHDFGAKSTGMGALSIWTHHLKDWKFYDKYVTKSYSGPAFKLGAGIQAFEAYRYAKDHNVTIVSGEGKTIGHVGGYTQGGGHSPLTPIWGMAADQVLSVGLVTASGRFITADAATNPDIFWAIRGGGGSTFGVVTSMVVRAYPQIRVTTMRYNMTTNANFTHDKFWAAQRAYVDDFAKYGDLGYYSYYRIRHNGSEIIHDMTSWVAPNTSEGDFRASIAPMVKKWEDIGVPFNPIIREYDNFHDAWVDGFPLEVWTVTMRQASRFFPRENIVDEAKRKAAVDSIRGVFDEGANMIMFNMQNPPGSELVDNAVNPAWRKVLMFAIMFVTWNTTNSPELATSLSRNLTYEWNPRWIALTPGSGTYMSESDYIEPNWRESFHGSKYGRLLEIKRKWDPEMVFYAQNAVGSELWEMSEMIMGHLPSQNSKLCRKLPASAAPMR